VKNVVWQFLSFAFMEKQISKKERAENPNSAKHNIFKINQIFMLKWKLLFANLIDNTL